MKKFRNPSVFTVILCVPLFVLIELLPINFVWKIILSYSLAVEFVFAVIHSFLFQESSCTSKLTFVRKAILNPMVVFFWNLKTSETLLLVSAYFCSLPKDSLPDNFEGFLIGWIGTLLLTIFYKAICHYQSGCFVAVQSSYKVIGGKNNDKRIC